MLVAFQVSVDNAVSKTINLPVEASSEVVADVYRYGNRTGQVLQLGAGEELYEKEHVSQCDPYQLCSKCVKKTFYLSTRERVACRIRQNVSYLLLRKEPG
ncbi:MAG TPA: hypothetical protein VKX46_06120 [Ktedonobacteraceae bacterium]|nr:hypothetical protein [Ktedonobacteraceae bacterium]